MNSTKILLLFCVILLKYLWGADNYPLLIVPRRAAYPPLGSPVFFAINLFQAIIIVVGKNWTKSIFKEVTIKVTADLLRDLIMGLIKWLVLPGLGGYVLWQIFISKLGFLFSPVTLPVWLVGVLTIISAWALLRFLIWFASTRLGLLKEPLTLKDYKIDYLLGLVWRWDYTRDNKPDHTLWCFCPEPGCDTRLVFDNSIKEVDGKWVPSTAFSCETCEKEIENLEGIVDTVLDRVARQIERKINTGEWKDVVRRAKAGDLVPKIERPPME